MGPPEAFGGPMFLGKPPQGSEDRLVEHGSHNRTLHGVAARRMCRHGSDLFGGKRIGGQRVSAQCRRGHIVAQVPECREGPAQRATRRRFLIHLPPEFIHQRVHRVSHGIFGRWCFRLEGPVGDPEQIVKGKLLVLDRPNDRPHGLQGQPADLGQRADQLEAPEVRVTVLRPVDGDRVARREQSLAQIELQRRHRDTACPRQLRDPHGPLNGGLDMDSITIYGMDSNAIRYRKDRPMPLTLSPATLSTAGILLLTIVAVESGGWYMLRLLRGAASATPFQIAFSRAGHAHAGVLVILSLVVQLYADAAAMSGIAGTIARSAVPLAAILMPAGFFLSAAGQGRPVRMG